MYTLEACMTWAVPVKITSLGAHVEAYIKLLPTISALRLCHRFGLRDNAGISRMPVELINAVEEYIIEEERAKVRTEWSEVLKCWESRCLPLDHFPKETWAEMYTTHFFELEHDLDDDLEREVPGDELSQDQIDDLNSELAEFDDYCCNEHYDNRCGWQRRTGRPQDEGSDFFSEHAELMRKHFGLETWVSHTQLRQRLPGQQHTGGILASTLSYLILPKCGKFTKDLNLMYPDSEFWDDEGPPYLPTKTGIATSVEMPTALSPKSATTFRRAMKILALKPYGKQEIQASLFVANDNDEPGVKCEAVATPGQSSAHCQINPQLMLLMKHLHVPEI